MDVLRHVMPVFLLNEFGRDIVLQPVLQDLNSSVILQTNRASGNRFLVDWFNGEASTAGFIEQAAAGAVSTFDKTFERGMEFGMIVSVMRVEIVGNLTVGAGDTDTLSCEVILSRVDTSNVSKQLSDQTITVTGLTVNGTYTFTFDDVYMQETIGKGWKVRMRIILTATRTAGASTEQVGVRSLGTNSNGRTFLSIHAHPMVKHALEQFSSNLVD